jgi:hypothetical protein
MKMENRKSRNNAPHKRFQNARRDEDGLRDSVCRVHAARKTPGPIPVERKECEKVCARARARSLAHQHAHAHAHKRT